jgi:hypothetical protein
VIADHIDEGNVRTSRIVKIGETIAESGSEVEERHRGLARHSGVTIGGTGNDTFKEAQDAAHARLRVERGDEVHLTGARVAKTDFDAIGVQSCKK